LRFDALAAPRARERNARKSKARVCDHAICALRSQLIANTKNKWLRSLLLRWASRSVVVIAGGREQRHWPTASQLPVDTASPRREQR
jgi:hypothetical protein